MNITYLHIIAANSLAVSLVKIEDLYWKTGSSINGAEF